jgi:non-canonical poly(A) RNA polymerase PAPD5/7
MRGLNEVYSGGLGSYGLTLMVSNFLKVHPLLQRGVIREEDNLGVLFMDFLDLFGRRFNYDLVAISIDPERFYSPKVK